MVHDFSLYKKLQKNYDVLNLGLTELDLRNPNKILGKISVDKDLINHRKNLWRF